MFNEYLKIFELDKFNIDEFELCLTKFYNDGVNRLHIDYFCFLYDSSGKRIAYEPFILRNEYFMDDLISIVYYDIMKKSNKWLLDDYIDDLGFVYKKAIFFCIVEDSKFRADINNLKRIHNINIKGLSSFHGW